MVAWAAVGVVWCEPPVYVALLSDRAMFAGMVSAASSIIASSASPWRLRILTIVPRDENEAVEEALQCTLEANATQGRPMEKAKRKRNKGFWGSGTWFSTESGASLAVVSYDAVHHREEDVTSKKDQRLKNAFNYARFYLHELPEYWLPRSADRLVYLDVDVTVRSDVVDLAYAFDATDFVVAAVTRKRDLCKTLISCTTKALAKLEEQGIRDVDHDLLDFNAGVMVLWLATWRSGKVLRDVETWIRLNRDLRFFKLGTNPPLVLAARRKGVVPLDKAWNYQFEQANLANLTRAKEKTEQARIVHFSGRIKPWEVTVKDSRDIMGWRLPARAHTCSAELRHLGIRVRRGDRHPVTRTPNPDHKDKEVAALFLSEDTNKRRGSS